MSAAPAVECQGGTPASRLQELAEAVRRLTRLPEVGQADRLYHLAVAALHELLATATAAEQAGASMEEMRAIVVDARAFHGCWSRTLAHAQAWPRGYPGDFEMVERLLDAIPDGELGTLAYALDDCVLQLPIVAQHRAKVAWQAELVRRGMRRRADLKVLSIGCGGSRDLMLLEPEELSPLRLVLMDLDPNALALSRTRLRGQVRELTCVEGHALRSANRLALLGPFDVVVVGGLLD